MVQNKKIVPIPINRKSLIIIILFAIIASLFGAIGGYVLGIRSTNSQIERVYTITPSPVFESLTATIIPEYASGEIILSLKPYTDTNKLDEFIRLHPELSIKETNLSPPSYATLSLKPYSEWQKRVSPSQKDDPEVQKVITEGFVQLKQIYENVKNNPLLSDSNIRNSFYSDIEPKRNDFAAIHISFKRDVTEKEREIFFQQYPQLEIVDDYEESKTYTISVPEGKEQYWVSQFIQQEFVKGATVNSIMRLQ